MIVGVPKEKVEGERRVALVPELVPRLAKAGLEIIVQYGAGQPAGFLDASYLEKGARVEPDALAAADIVLKVQPPTIEEIGAIKQGATLVGFLQPYSNRANIQVLAERRITAFAMELMPRITRAQSMDALRSCGQEPGKPGTLGYFNSTMMEAT